ncbi:hypothetical protein [Flammeovirga aprica]|uniref:Uncharacterized protein n=1 Tax=Flammeovirga aprica JL-4 TaxID=694437 RepID=A0A7X9S204_9BACT|nr:hypothetical protein [Flammeovirga aprica]NME72831.1 hypothetical protein [Flammeovirga aprica JL-4]
MEAETDFFYYKKAFTEIILNTDSFRSSYCYSNDDYVIMHEIVPQEEMSHFSDKEFEDNISHTSSDTVFISGHYPFHKFLGKRKSRLKVYFSEMKHNIFLAEVLCDGTKKNIKYKDLPPFGSSQVFMFKVDSGNVLLINESVIMFN